MAGGSPKAVGTVTCPRHGKVFVIPKEGESDQDAMARVAKAHQKDG